MTKVILNQIINQLDTLELEELQQLNQAIQKSLAEFEASAQKTRFHRVLLTSGLVKDIKPSRRTPQRSRELIQVNNQPVSETIIEERR